MDNPEQLKPCPFCGELSSHLYTCKFCDVICTVKEWNTRPIEDELRAEIFKLKNEHFIECAALEGCLAQAQNKLDKAKEILKKSCSCRPGGGTCPACIGLKEIE